MACNVSRRDFLKVSGAIAASAIVPLGSGSVARAAPASAKRWFKGNLHMHSQWSDGEPLPEWAVDWYKSHGYDFICPSDHNLFQADKLRFEGFGFENRPSDVAPFKNENSLWKAISPKPAWAKLTRKHVDETIAKFGNDSVRTITAGDQTYVRMTPFAELERMFAEPGKFLMIPGYEQTGGCENGQQVHVNFINVREVFPYISADTPREILARTFAKAQECYAGQNYFFMANHPLWRYYDYSPNDLIALPQIRVFELNNNGFGDYDGHPEGWKPEKFWDVVNAHRAAHDQPLLLAMGSDDRHSYAARPKAWCMVRAANLTLGDIMAAINAGDLYASNGLDFADVQFDGKTLSVKIDVREEGAYRITFVGTKKDYDPACRSIDVEKGPRNPARRIDLFSDSIGMVLDTIEGIEGSYTLKPDDLYVRAKIVKVGPKLRPDWESAPAAWTQAYR